MAFASANASSSMSDINVTPLVDVMLVLLIIFMMTAPMLDNRQQLTLPGVTEETPPKPTEPLQLRVEAGDVYSLAGIAVTPAQLDAGLSEWHAQNPEGVLKVDIDPQADYQSAARAMAAADRAGIDNIGLTGI